MDLIQLTQILSTYKELSESLSFEQLIKFIYIISLLKPVIGLKQTLQEHKSAPERLSIDVHNFLRVAVGFPDNDTLKLAWYTLRHLAWQMDHQKIRQSLGADYIQLFLDHGLERGIVFYHFFPPKRVCDEPGCKRQLAGDRIMGIQDFSHPSSWELTEPITVSVTVFTQEFGPIPGKSTSLYCHNCHTRYYHNYYVHDKASMRSYYQGSFEFIHIAQHVYIATKTCELFTSMMLTSWTSATNCARIYNNGMALSSITPSLPAAYSKSLELDTEDVWCALCLFWLLEDSLERGEILELMHNMASQAKRLEPALRARNLRMVGPGQEEWNHICDLCCWINTLPDGSKTFLRSAVTDGITIGHPCCRVQDCTVPLLNVKQRFCPIHKDEDKKCSVTACDELATEGHRTCENADHRSLEDYANEKNKAMFQLKHRLARLKVSQPTDAFTSEAVLDGVEAEASSAGFVDEELDIAKQGDCIQDCTDKPETGNRTLRARFGRKRTHNEQICVASCGVILGRATFYGSEAPNGVRTFWMTLFPTKASLPGVLWHDNNCRVRLMLKNDTDPYLRHYFDDIALPVDVFHFKSKHKESDIECGTYCNPYQWPELWTEEGGWRFNSSAAEQANAWIGGYQSIVREMQVDRYEFFLDEMIKRRNRLTIKALEKKLKGPSYISREYLLSPH